MPARQKMRKTPVSSHTKATETPKHNSTADMFQLYFFISLGLIFSIMLWQHCAQALVRLRHKNHSVKVSRRSCFLIVNHQIPVLSPQTQLEIGEKNASTLETSGGITQTHTQTHLYRACLEITQNKFKMCLKCLRACIPLLRKMVMSLIY